MTESSLYTKDPIIEKRRERVFLVLSGLFLGSLAMLNILGISRFLIIASWDSTSGLTWGEWGEISFAVAVGAVSYTHLTLPTKRIV